MTDQLSNQKLNQLLIDLGHSLLQFLHECRPWEVATSADARRKVYELAERQRASVGQIVELLQDRRASIDRGVYPTDYTNLHFVGLEYFYSQLVENGRAIISSIEDAAEACSADAEAVSLLDQILASERESLKDLEELADSHG